MAIAYVDGRRLARALRAAIRAVLKDQEYLNTINVFPVPDGDTGTNLALTLGAIAEALSGSRERHAGQLLVTVADAALDGSRGNSGAILAQCFQGLADALAEQARITPAAFATALAMAADYARDALSKPVAGTLVTVIEDVAEAAGAAGEVADFAALAVVLADEAAAARDRTTGQLEALRKAQVVDAGAAGFADMLEGVRQLIQTGSVREADDDLSVEVQHGFERVAGDVDASGFRYCTECMVTGEAIDRRRLRDALGLMGDSLVIAGTHNKIKVHIHTDTPGEVFDASASFGTVSSTKADDMHSQQEAGHQTQRRVAVLTDSAADIADDDLERLHIHTAPVRVHFGKRGYLDKLSISPDEFFRLLRSADDFPTTSQPAPGDLRRQYEFLASHFDSVVSLHIGAANSGTFQAAQAAAARSNAAKRIHVIDSLNASLGQGLIAVHAAECAETGADVEQVLAEIERVIPRTRTFAAVGDMSYGVRGGRVPPAVKAVTDFLHLTPVLGTRPSGRVALAGALFGRGDIGAKFARFILRRMSKDKAYRLSVGFGENRAAGEALLAALLSGASNVTDASLAQIGSALGAHSGPEVLLAAMQEVDDNPVR